MNTELNHQQRVAARSNHPRVLALASPGSGKTRTLVERIAYLVGSGCNPVRIVTITFTNVGAAEIRDRLQKIIPKEVESIGYIGTLHGYCLRLLEKYGEAIGYHPRISVLDEERAKALLADALKEIGYKVSKSDLDYSKQQFGPRAAKSGPLNKANLAVAHYYSKLKRGNAVDYDGLLFEAIALLEKTANRPDQFPRIEHLLVDEYQDSTEIDHSIYEALSPENVWIVGDPDQAIFSFRGGKMANILALANDPTWQKHFFTANYRSDDEICACANRLIRHNKNRVYKQMVSATQRRGKMTVNTYFDDEDEVSSIFAQISAFVQAPSGFSSAGWAQACRYEDIAILVRSNAIAEEFRDGALRRDIPLAQATTADPEKDIPGWKFARATVDMLNAPSNDFIFRHWLTLARGKEFADDIAQKSGILRWPMASHYFSDAVVGDGAPHGTTLTELPGRLLSLGTNPYAVRAIDKIIATLPAGSELPEVSLAMQTATSNVVPAPGGLTVSTIHGAKGREWGVVFLAALEVGILPNNRAIKEEGGMEEERRLAFVGATRAARWLFVSSARKRKQQWGLKALAPAEPSPFVAELLQ